ADLEGKGVFPESHPLCLGVFGVGARGPAAAYLEQGVDLLVTLGARLDDTTTVGFSPVFERAGELVQLDHSPARLGRAFVPAVAMACDLPRALERIVSALPVLEPELRGLRRSAVSVLEERLGGRGDLAGETGPPLDPRAATAALRRAFGPRAVFTADIGNHMLFAAQTLEIDHPEQLYVATGLGAMCSGIGAAIGMQLAWGGERQVISICGDGGLLMGGNEIATCSRYGIPLVVAVFNDGRLGMVAHGCQTVYGRTPDNRTAPIDVAAYAGSLGATATRVESLASLDAIAARPRGNRPLVLDIPVDPDLRPSNPRTATLNFTG
ncbi:MAG TPA: thiamine pyrophosphate-dependent enzyme, partial [Thermoanaerobaculia bacterium]